MIRKTKKGSTSDCVNEGVRCLNVWPMATLAGHGSERVRLDSMTIPCTDLSVSFRKKLPKTLHIGQIPGQVSSPTEVVSNRGWLDFRRPHLFTVQFAERPDRRRDRLWPQLHRFREGCSNADANVGILVV